MHAGIRLRDLKQRQRGSSRLMNVKIPVYVSDAIERVARDLDASKTEVVIALLNEGIEASAAALKGWRPPKSHISPPGRVCTVAGCRQSSVAKGYCAAHYQAARRGRLKAVSWGLGQ
jgi:hypothetical protein